MGHPRRVVITGMGVVTSLGDSLDRFWAALCAGQSGVGPLTLFDTTEFKVHFGGQVRDWDPVARFGVKEARHLDRFAQFALAAADSAVEDSGIDFSKLPAEQCGVFIGSGIGGLNEFETQHSTMMQKGPSRISPFVIPKLMVNAASGQVSIRWGLQGPCSAVATACASAANAIGDAYQLIQSGHADVMITGGSEAAITHMGLGGFASMRALSTRNDDPPRASRPFDRDRDGFVLAEGAGILVLEAEELARARGARIYAEVLGYGMSADGWHITAPDEEGRGAARAMKRCFEDAGLSPKAVDYINAHGTSTPLGDLAETLAMKQVFGAMLPGSRSPAPRASSATPGRLRRRRADHLGPGDPHRRASPDHQSRPPRRRLRPRLHPQRRPRGPRRHVMSNSFGFGGHNASLLIGRYFPGGRA